MLSRSHMALAIPLCALLAGVGCSQRAARNAPAAIVAAQPGPVETTSGSLRALRREYDQLNVSAGRLAPAAERLRGRPVGIASYSGDGNGYARGLRRVRWKTGETVRYGISMYLPVGFRDRVQGQVDLMRWDNWPDRGGDADWGGVSIWGGDHRARLLRFSRRADEDVLVGPFTLPEGRWFRLTVVQRLGAARGASEVFLDGRKIGRSVAPNTYGRRIVRVRYGLVAVDPSRQRRPLRLAFAAPSGR